MIPAGSRDRSVVTTIRLAAVVALLVGLAFVQDPGFLVSDTKFDLVLAPGDFLARAAHLWDGEGAFGQLQNQAYGYLWPMGPFFLLGSVIDLPGWVVQRLWQSLVMSVAFVGSARVARALGVRSDLACIVAALAYALSPRMLTTLGPISIEAWPSALAPWVLLPLIRGSMAGSPRRAAALSAGAVAMVGGVNAAATFAVLPLGIVWLLTRERGPRRRSLMLWWPLFTALGTLWWLVPLFVMGAYSPPFLDFIESASITTFPTTLFDAIRGTSDWVPYVDAQARAGNDLLRQFYLPLNSGVVLLLGLAGLMHRGNRNRQFLVLSLALGLVLVTMGHTGSVQGWWAPELRVLLDGPLAPLRNVHKFDPVVRLPLALGLAWTLEVATRPLRRGSEDRTVDPDRPLATPMSAVLRRSNQLALVAMALVVVAGASLPALTGRIEPAKATLAIPGYWTQTADWLGQRSGAGSALLLPGSAFADYVWGAPKDEPMQALARSRWAVRNVIPLTPPGNIRMLDGIESRMAQGWGSPGLPAALRRAGVRFLVVRNDLTRSDDVPDPVLVHQALAASPGIERVAAFGPEVGGQGHLTRAGTRVLVSGGWQASYPAVEIFEVRGAGNRAEAASTLPVVAGGPEDLPDLTDLGVLGDQPTRLAEDTPPGRAPDGPVVLTDGLRTRERFFGRLHDGDSAMLTPGDVRRSGNPVRDYLSAGQDRWATRTRLDGVRSISASSSMSDSTTVGGAVTGRLPFAAVDGDPGTAWMSQPGKELPAWWQVDYLRPLSPGTVTITGAPAADPGQSVRVRTRAGASRVVDVGPGETRVVPLPDGETSWLRVEDASGVPGRQLALSEVATAGVTARRSLVLPRLPAAWGTPDTVVMRRLGDRRTGCVRVAADVRCVQGRGRAPEEPADMRRVVDLSGSALYRPRLVVSPRPGAALEALLQRRQPVVVSADSEGVDDVRASALAAVDGDPGTTWTADRSDLRPTLRLRWLGVRPVSGIALSVDPDAAARRPESVTLTWPGGTRRVKLNRSGEARFARIRTDQLAVRVEDAEPVSDLGFDRASSTVPVGISELRLTGVPFLPRSLPTRPVRYPCGSGPRVRIGSQTWSTSVRAAPADLARAEAVPAELCAPSAARLGAGENQVVVSGATAFAPDSLVLERLPRTEAAGGGGTPGAALVSSAPARRVLRPGSGARYVGLRENANPGWHASQAGKALAPVVLDGWKQGFELRDDTHDVVAVFTPDRSYRWGLGLGAVGLLALAVALLVPGRRWPGRDLPAVRARVVTVPVIAAAGLLAAGTLAGWPGVLVAVGGGLLAVALRRWAPEFAAWLLAGCCLVAAAAYAFEPWGSRSGWAGDLAWPHYLVLVSLTGAVVTAIDGVRRPRSFRRMARRSTRR